MSVKNEKSPVLVSSYALDIFLLCFFFVCWLVHFVLFFCSWKASRLLVSIGHIRWGKALLFSVASGTFTCHHKHADCHHPGVDDRVFRVKN